MFKSMNVLFTSRHNLTEEQLNDLCNLFSGVKLNIETENVTYQSKSRDAIPQLANVCKQKHTDVLIGVFPAHIAASIATSSTNDYGETRIFDGFAQKIIVLVPVSEAVFAEEDGKPRGFKHSHFEVIAGFDLISRAGLNPYKFVS